MSKKQTRSKERQLSPAEAILKAAEEYAIPCIDVLRFPEVSRFTGLDPEDLTRSSAIQAEALRRERMAEIRNRLEEYNDSIRRPYGRQSERYPLENPPIDKPEYQSDRKKEPLGRGKRQTLEGFPITASLRTLGKEGWNFEDAKEALGKIGIYPADETIRIQLLAGRKGRRGEPAELSPETLDRLRKSLAF